MNYTIYTDGAYSSMRNQGGVGVVVLKDNTLILKFSKMFKDTTNNRMELSAVIYALRCVKNNIDTLTIISDSQYVLGTITKNWKRKKNQDLWKVFDITYEDAKQKCKEIKWEWTKGHSNNEWNNLCDELAVNASHEI